MMMSNGDVDGNDDFESIAKELDCDESDDALDKAFEKINPKVEKEPDEKDDQEE